MILYFNHQYLKHPTIQQIIIDNRGSDTLSNLLGVNKLNIAHSATYSRKGTNLLPFKYELTNVPGFDMPDYDPDYNRSWTEVTDQRCLDLRASHWHRPWVLFWSGGIDSTVIVAAIIKNLPRADFDNITIACNAVSIWENPQFYFDHIKPNFKIVNSKGIFLGDNSQNAYLINSDPADQLFGCLGGYLDTLHQNPELLHTNIINNKDCAIDFFTNIVDKKFAEWYYHVLVTNANSAGVPATTLYDLMWWSGFNNAWASVKLGFLTQGKRAQLKNAKHYIDEFINWFDSKDYQLWSMNRNNVAEQLGANPSEVKLAAKKYIYSVDNNRYYFKFKTKMPSIDMINRVWVDHWCCIDDQWNLLNLTDHRDQIISMLPDHLV